MRRRSLAILTVLALVAGGWFIYHVMSAPSSPALPAIPATQRVQTINGETVVTVPADRQRASGIAVAPVAVTRFQPERFAYASVIDPQPLFELGNRLAAARSDLTATRAQASTSQEQSARMQALYRDNRNVSQKNVQEAQAAAQSDQARLHAAETVLTGLEAEVRQQFGEPLARAAATPASELMHRLSNGEASIVRVTFPPSEPMPAPASLMVDASGGHLLAARKLSAAPQVDPALQGNSYFYRTAAALPAGTRAVAHIAMNTPELTGMFIPDSAIVWYGNERWVYVRTANDRFARRLLSAPVPAKSGVIVTSGFHPGDNVVIRGAELLLSEEQRPQGIATQCKDPPECDD